MKELYIEPIFDVISLVSCTLTTSGNGTRGGGVSSGGSDDSGFYGGDWNE